MKNHTSHLLFMAITISVCFLAGCANSDKVHLPAPVESDATEPESGNEKTDAAEPESGNEKTDAAEPESGNGKKDAAEPEISANENELPFSFADISNLEFWFSSGAGAWWTVLTVHDDGTFEGEYTDSDMGSSEASYPNGTQYLCNFTGKFTEPVKVDDYTYSVNLQRIELAQKPEYEEIKDGVRLIYSTPYGLDDAKEILFYLPGAPVQELPLEYRQWTITDGDSIDTQLPFYGLYNVNAGQGFSSYKKATIDEQLEALEQEVAILDNKLKTESLSQAKMSEISLEIYHMWDSELNVIWNQLKENMDEEAMAVLTAEELEWIAYKEAEIQKAGAKVMGGTLQPMVEYVTGTKLTKVRVYELAEYLRKM